MQAIARIAAAAAVVAAAWGASPARANLIENGNFEACDDVGGDPISSLCGTWSFANFAAVNNGIGAGGSKGVRLESDGSPDNDPTAIQTVAGLVIGVTYQLGWDVDFRINAGGSANGPSFGVFLGSQIFENRLHLDSHLTNGYVSETVSFVATATSHTFIFAGELDGRSNGAGRTDVSYNLDNVFLLRADAIPVPGPLSLLAAALACAAGMRRFGRSTRRLTA